MHRQWLAFSGAIIVATVAQSLSSGGVGAQTPAPAKRPAAASPAQRTAKKWTPPRTPDGHVDLQGTYDVATITPLERPQGITSLGISDQEAAALEAYEAQRNAKDLAPSSGDRPAPDVGGDRGPTKSYLEGLFRAGGGAVGGYNLFWLAPGTQVMTIDGQHRSSIIVDPPDGRVPPMKPEARRRNAAYLSVYTAPDAAEGAAGGPPGQYDGPELRPLAERCLLGFNNTSGPPTLPNYFYNNMKQIVQTPETIVILVEMVHDARIIRMNQPHLPQQIRKWMGDSVGHWEGDTLVVDTTNFTAKTQFHGSAENLHVVERFTRLDPDTLLYRFTVDDPTTWDRSWSGEYPWRASNELLYEYACHEGNHALPGVLRGARVQEARAKEKEQQQPK
jgi:hypothetical protein